MEVIGPEVAEGAEIGFLGGEGVEGVPLGEGEMECAVEGGDAREGDGEGHGAAVDDAGGVPAGEETMFVEEGSAGGGGGGFEAGDEAEGAGFAGRDEADGDAGEAELVRGEGGGVGSRGRLETDEDFGDAGVDVFAGDPEEGVEATGGVDEEGGGGAVEGFAGDEGVSVGAEDGGRVGTEGAGGIEREDLRLGGGGGEGGGEQAEKSKPHHFGDVARNRDVAPILYHESFRQKHGRTARGS